MIQKVIACAAQTAGAIPNARDRQWLRQCATLALAAYRETQQARRQLQKLARNSEILRRQAKVVGAATSCVLWAALGDPRDFAWQARNFQILPRGMGTICRVTPT